MKTIIEIKRDKFIRSEFNSDGKLTMRREYEIKYLQDTMMLLAQKVDSDNYELLLASMRNMYIKLRARKFTFERRTNIE